MVERIDPAFAADEFTTLCEFLDFYRATLLIKVDGLCDLDARARACPPSNLNLMGLVRHMADVERSWFRRTLMDEAAPPIFYNDANIDGDLEPSTDDTLAAARDALDAEIAVSRRNVRDMSLDRLALVDRPGDRPSLRWIMVHMIEEYARHCGHADLLREAIDASTGD